MDRLIADGFTVSSSVFTFKILCVVTEPNTGLAFDICLTFSKRRRESLKILAVRAGDEKKFVLNE